MLRQIVAGAILGFCLDSLIKHVSKRFKEHKTRQQARSDFRILAAALKETTKAVNHPPYSSIPPSPLIYGEKIYLPSPNRMQ